jgi:hypothetical protein
MNAARCMALAALLAGCAENAVLELAIGLPQAAGDRQYALTSVNRATDARFEIEREAQSFPAVELDADRQVDCISLQTKDESSDLEIRVRFCTTPDCGDLADASPPTRYFRLAHPFYIGRRTFWTTEIAEVPECTDDAGCSVGRCIDGRCGCASDADCCTGGCACPTDEEPVGGTCYVCEDGPDTPTGEDTPDICVEAVDRCRVRGCQSGTPRSFCLESGDRDHFCDLSTWQDVVDRNYGMVCPLE